MKPKILVSTDWHLKPSNLEEIYKLQEQEILEAKKLGIKNHVWLGDIFDSRISQREEVLNTLTKIIELYQRYGHCIFCIPGNHDKTSYESETSFLDAFQYHPNFKLITRVDYFTIEKIFCFFIPFFTNEIWCDEYKQIDSAIKLSNSILFTHLAFQGSRNNDGTLVESSITPSMFKDWGKVFSGHYHDHQELTDNVIHLGSITQNDFGEDENKGFWVIYEDLSYDLIPSDGKKYRKLVVNLDEMTFKQVDKVIKKFKEENNDSFVRVEIKGSEDAIKSIDKKEYQSLGIDVKTKVNEIENIDGDIEEVRALTSTDIADKFKLFCEQNEYDYDEGIEILKEVI